MLLWNHPYVATKSFLQGMTAYNKTRGSRTLIPLNTTIRAPGPTAQKPRILLLLPDWETGHLDLTPQSKRHLLEEHTIDQEHTNPEENRTSTWSHDGGEALGRLGNQIIGGHRLTNPANSIPPKRLRFTIIDHCTYTLLHKHADPTPQTLHPREPLRQNYRPPNPHATGTNMHGRYLTYTTDSRMPERKNTQGE